MHYIGSKRRLAKYRDNDPKFFDISKEQYYYYKDKFKNGETDWIVGYVGFLTTYLSKFFGSYDNRRSYRLGRFNNLYKQSRSEQFKNIKFINSSFDKLKISNSLIYLDPPYQNTTKYTYTQKFDYDHLWKKCWDWSQDGNTILLSELDAPYFFKCIFEKPIKYSLSGNTKEKIEKLFIFDPDLYLTFLESIWN